MYSDLEANTLNAGPNILGDPYGLNLASSQWAGAQSMKDSRMKIFASEDSETDEAVRQEVDTLKEEMSSINTDIELLEWAKKRVFAPASVDEVGPTFSRAYPQILAHLLRTVRINFDNPHLTLALFAHAQTHSLESYLTGCLAPAYNELLSARWESFRDFDGVEQGVREMQMNGVDWDRITQKIVSRVVEDIMGELSKSKSKARWAQDIPERLAALDGLVQGDLDDQESIWNRQRLAKQAVRRGGGFSNFRQDSEEPSNGGAGRNWAN
jgi:hypothetical protein